jgi:DNA replication protein DnaC
MRPDELLRRIREALEQLSLKEMAAQLDLELSSGPRRGEDRLELLWRLLEPQLIARRQRSCQCRIRRAKLPARKSFDRFDFDFQPELDRDRVMQLATLEFVRRGENLLVAGMSGTGKSHICIAIGYLACAAGIYTRYTTSAEMLGTLAASLATGSLAKTLKIYTRPPLLIVDEVGLDRPEREATPDAQLFYKVIRPRHQAPRSTIITSNIKWDDWGQYLGDEVATVAILDRLIQHGHLLTINGPSWRAFEHERLNAAHTQPAEQGKAGRSPRAARSKKATKKASSKKRPRKR